MVAALELVQHFGSVTAAKRVQGATVFDGASVLASITSTCVTGEPGKPYASRTRVDERHRPARPARVKSSCRPRAPRWSRRWNSCSTSVLSPRRSKPNASRTPKNQASLEKSTPHEKNTLRYPNASRTFLDMGTRVVGYIRVSTEKQADHGISLAAQRAKIEAYALAMDLDLVTIVEDAGISAKTLDRPGLCAALSMLTSGKADALLVTKLDRLTRSVRDLGDLIEKFFKKYSLLSMSDQIDTRSAMGRCMLNLMTTMSQWERETTGERTRDALAHKKAKGEFCGGEPPYGFSVQNGALVSNEAEQDVLRIVREMFAAGLSMNAITNELRFAGLIPRSGKTWHVQQIKRMLAA